VTGTILYIDDAAELPDGFARTLRREGYDLVRIADPEEAIRLVETRRPALVLMELLLASCDGLDLLQGIRECADVPVVVLTRAARLPGLYGQAVALGAKDFLSKPVLASQLETVVQEFATAPPPPQMDLADTALSDPGSRAASGELCGELSDTPLPELLRRLNRRGATGSLIVSRGTTRIGVQLRNGSPVAVTSSRGREPIDAFLLRTGRIQREQHERVRAGASRGEGSPREILVATGILTERDVASAIRRQAEEQLFEVFGWPHGSYRFVAGRRLKAESALVLERDPRQLVLEGVLGASPIEQLRDRIRKHSTLYVSGADPGPWRLFGPELTARQESLLGELNGAGTLGELLQTNAFEPRHLYGLWVAGRIELHAEPTLTLLEELSADGIEDPAATDAAPGPSHGQPLGPEDVARLLRRLGRRVLGHDDFAVLGVTAIASDAQRRLAYERLLAEIPSEASGSADPEVRELARRIRDRLDEAYANLEDPETRRAYSILQHAAREDRDVEADAKRALEAERWFRKGEVSLRKKRHDEAVEAFGMAAHLDPNEGEYLSHLGYAMFLSDPQQDVVQREAMEHIANGVKRSPDRELSYVFLGRILRAKGDVETARKVLRRALRVNPDCHPARQELRLLDFRERRGKGLLGRLRALALGGRRERER
jgi:CheY-like chemotaxis protein/tetratricopeptide (TPR) repeat protein